MDNNKTMYLCKNKVYWKWLIFFILGISILWSCVLFIPRSGISEKDVYFFILLALGLGMDLLFVYAGLLRQWSKVWIQDGIVYSRTAHQGLIPLNGQMPLAEVTEVCFVYNGRIDRKNTAYPNLKEMKIKMAAQIEPIISSHQIKSPIILQNSKYYFPARCGTLILRNSTGKKLRVNLQMIFYQANMSEVKKFISFLPKNIKYTWHYGTVYVDFFWMPF